MISLLSKALVPLSVFVVFALARKFLPAMSPTQELTDYPLDELSQRFSRTQWVVGIAMLLAALTFAWVTHAILSTTNSWLAERDAGAFHLLPQPAIWWFFPGFGAITLTWEIVLRIWSTVGNAKEASLYRYWSDIKTGFNATKLLRFMALFIAVPIGVATLLAVPMHSSVGNDRILEYNYASLIPKVFLYKDAQRMAVIDGFRGRDGTLTQRAGVILSFTDGRKWSSAEWGDFKKTSDTRLVEFLQEKTGLVVEHAETEADLNN